MSRPQFDGWAWAVRARDKMRACIKGLPHAVEPGGPPVVALFGRTQEGKTSLALRLLGASPEKATEIASALRGEKKTGESATPVVSRYRATPGAPPLDLRGIAEEVKRARRDRSRELAFDLPLPGSPVREVVDLVGLESKDAEEAAYALDKARRYVGYADLHVYVSAADHLVDLVSSFSVETSSVMNGWIGSPDCSVVVLTQAFEEESVREIVAGASSADDLRGQITQRLEKLLREELCAEGRTDRADERRLPPILPVFLGPPELAPVPIVMAATESALNSVGERIGENPSRLRARAGFGFHRLVRDERRRKTQEIRDASAQKARVDKQREELANRARELEEEAREARSTEQRAEAEVRTLQDGLRGAVDEFCQSISGLVPSDESGTKGSTREALSKMWLSFNARLLAEVREARDRLKNRTRIDVAEKVEAEFAKFLAEVDEVLAVDPDSLVVHSWRRLGFSDRERSVALLVTEGVKRRELIRARRDKWLSRLEEACSSDRKNCEQAARRSRENQERIQREIADLAERQRARDAESLRLGARLAGLQKSVDQLKSDRAEAGRYVEWLVQEFTHEWNSCTDRAERAAKDDAVSALMEVLAEMHSIQEILADLADLEEERSHDAGSERESVAPDV